MCNYNDMESLKTIVLDALPDGELWARECQDTHGYPMIVVRDWSGDASTSRCSFYNLRPGDMAIQFAIGGGGVMVCDVMAVTWIDTDGYMQCDYIAMDKNPAGRLQALIKDVTE